MTELKPCPFCGGKAELTVLTLGIAVRVRCKKCFAQSDAVDASVDYVAKDRAIELWNRRVDDG